MSKYDVSHQNMPVAQAAPNQGSVASVRRTSQAAAIARARRERYQGDLSERHERTEEVGELINTAQQEVAHKLA